MGNIAPTASDVASFWHHLHASRKGDGKGFFKQKTYEAAISWAPLSAGGFAVCGNPAGPCLRYGIAMLNIPSVRSFSTVNASSGKPEENVFEWDIFGHAGEDWGSGIDNCGWSGEVCTLCNPPPPPPPPGKDNTRSAAKKGRGEICSTRAPQGCATGHRHTLNISTAYAYNSMAGMNYSLSYDQNHGANSAIECLLMRSVAIFADPTFPYFDCPLELGTWQPKLPQ